MRTHLRNAVIAGVLALAIVPATAAASPARSGRHNSVRAALPPLNVAEGEGCEFIDNPGNSVCMLPFPDDYYTVADPSSATGRRVAFNNSATPANQEGAHIEAAPYNAADGFSPGSTILLPVQGIQQVEDLKPTKAVPINHLARYTKADAPVVVIDASTGKRWPIWVEVDSGAGSSPANLEIHPAVSFASGHRYIVALRNLKNKHETLKHPLDSVTSATKCPPKKKPSTRGGRTSTNCSRPSQPPGSNARASTWPGTSPSRVTKTTAAACCRCATTHSPSSATPTSPTASSRASSPAFEVTSVQNEPNPGQIARRVKGNFTVPCFLFPDCGPGGRMHLDAEGNPIQNGTWAANFDCIIPLSVTTGPAEVARPTLYGHGLLGDAGEVASSPQRSLSQAHQILQCATDEIGMAESDVGTVIESLGNMSAFPAIPDRLQQGLLDELFLGRALINPAGFSTAAAFHQDGTYSTGSVINTSHLFYNGNSQGGIMGGALTAVSPDFTRASLGVSGMNYSVLVGRSVDFIEFDIGFSGAYPSGTVRPLVLDMVQMLWDRGEPDGYASRMTSDPLPDTPAHQVLMDIAFGDHQVTNFQADVEARTIGAYQHHPVLYPHRWPGSKPLWNVPRIKKYPFTGSAIYYYDIGPVRESPVGSGKMVGVTPPPLANIPNFGGEDPHSAPRAASNEQQTVSDFFEGSIPSTDNCEAKACFAGGFTGP